MLGYQPSAMDRNERMRLAQLRIARFAKGARDKRPKRRRIAVERTLRPIFGGPRRIGGLRGQCRKGHEHLRSITARKPTIPLGLWLRHLARGLALANATNQLHIVESSSIRNRPMTNSRFVYVTFIRTTPEKLWDALRLPEFCKQYWRGT